MYDNTNMAAADMGRGEPSASILELPPQQSAQVSQLCPLSKLAITSSRSGRTIVFIRDAAGALSALDGACFHHGAALADGDLFDLEDMGAVLRCPAHGKLVRVCTGELIEPGQDAKWHACGTPVQRTHQVIVDPATGLVRVCLSERAQQREQIDSDAYNLPSKQPAGSAVSGAASAASRGCGSLGFQCRRQRATQAVAKTALRRSGARGWRQLSIDAMVVGSGSGAATPAEAQRTGSMACTIGGMSAPSLPQRATQCAAHGVSGLQTSLVRSAQ